MHKHFDSYNIDQYEFGKRKRFYFYYSIRRIPKTERTLILALFGLTIVFGWAGNLLNPALHFHLMKDKKSKIGLLNITWRSGRHYDETQVYIRLGQWITPPNQAPYHAWGIDATSQHFVVLCEKLSKTRLGKYIAKYRVTSEHNSGCYFAEGQLFGIKHEAFF